MGPKAVSSTTPRFISGDGRSNYRGIGTRVKANFLFFACFTPVPPFAARIGGENPPVGGDFLAFIRARSGNGRRASALTHARCRSILPLFFPRQPVLAPPAKYSLKLARRLRNLLDRKTRPIYFCTLLLLKIFIDTQKNKQHLKLHSYPDEILRPR
ncbi:MAG: hypothetical protein WDA20_03720 [Desulfuromonadales bacterium]